MTYTPTPGVPTATVGGEQWAYDLVADVVPIDGTTNYSLCVMIHPGTGWQQGLGCFTLNDTNGSSFQPPDGSTPIMLTFSQAVAMFGATGLVAMFVPKVNAWLANRYSGGGPGPNPTPGDVDAVIFALKGYKSGADGMSVVAK